MSGNTIVKLEADKAEALASLAEKVSPPLAAELRKPGPFIVVVLR